MNNKIVLGSTFFLALYHFFCCGMPSISVILSGSTFLPVKKILSHTQMGGLLIFSGVLLEISFYFSYQKKECICSRKKMLFYRLVLYISLILYALAVYFHLFPESIPVHHMKY